MDTVDEVLKHVPRAYQEELFKQAQSTNVIAAADTGSGKTFIAALLIKWMSVKTSTYLEEQKIVFLVPKVPLVDQQRDFLANQVPLRIRGYKGDMGVEIWPKAKWHEEFSKADVLIMTPQIFFNVLNHAYWTLDRVSLLIFDECHHAQKRHPYNAIMQDHYYKSLKRPKIFGMTASPIWNPRNHVASLRDLQFNLSSVVIAVQDSKDELESHVPKALEIILRYPISPILFESYPIPSLWDEVQAQKLTEAIEADTLRGRYFSTLRAVGPLGADYYLRSHLMRKLSSLTSTSGTSALRGLVNGSTGPGITDIFTRLTSLLSTFEARFTSISSAWLSPKLNKLIETLVNYKSQSFHGIVFVEQRQVATAVAWLLQCLPETKEWIRCAALVGHGEAAGSGKAAEVMDNNSQKNIVNSFRKGELNLCASLSIFVAWHVSSATVIATAVAEEGLDFPTCELIVRYDGIKHMVGYVQSRGRARNRTSTFVIMVEENDEVELAKYETFRDQEPNLKKLYRLAKQEADSSFYKDDDGERDDPRDIAEREDYVVASTGARLTYSSAIPILHQLCDQIPHDFYTKNFKPTYSGDFTVKLNLPPTLPLPRDSLIYCGPAKRSKKEAKRAAAFLAVKNLHLLGVIDDHLSPLKVRKGDHVEDADGRPTPKVEAVPSMMEVRVHNPWIWGPPFYLHVVTLDGEPSAGLLCGISLSESQLHMRGTSVKVCGASATIDLSQEQCEKLERFARIGLKWCTTRTPLPIDTYSGCLIAPMNNRFNEVDWKVVEDVLIAEKGLADWTEVTREQEGSLLLVNKRRSGYTLLFHRVRDDLDINSIMNPQDTYEEHVSYAAFFARQFTPHNCPADEPDGPIIEVSSVTHRPFAVYSLDGTELPIGGATERGSGTFLLPQSFCKWIPIPRAISSVFQLLSPLCQRVEDVYRSSKAIEWLRLPSIHQDLLIEALTLPCAKAGFDNQRLETLGDAVLKLCSVVYVYNRFTFMHEGQLSRLKDNSVSNRNLLARAKEIGLERFLASEPRAVLNWQFTRSEVVDEGHPFSVRVFPRRSLQDCMEAILGASYLTGGIDGALHAGSALHLCFGGLSSWKSRYGLCERSPSAPLFASLQDSVGYSFRDGKLLVEAFTHPTFTGDEGPSYQRLEFLGDAVIDLVVMTYLFRKYPTATSSELSFARSRAVCNSTLSAVAVKRLSLHKFLLANNAELNKAIAKEVDFLSSVNIADVVLKSWRYYAPKALGDVLESLFGAILVDSGYDFALVSNIVEKILGDVLSILPQRVPVDPVSELMQWSSKTGCTRISFRKTQSNAFLGRNDSMAVVVHDQIISGPRYASNLSLAKGLVSIEALEILQDEDSHMSLKRICDCMQVAKEAQEFEEVDAHDVQDQEDLNDETEVGYLIASQALLYEIEEKHPRRICELEMQIQSVEEQDELERREVEFLLSPGPTGSGTDSYRPDSSF